MSSEVEDICAPPFAIATVEELEERYGVPRDPAIVKVAPRLTPEYRRLIAASPFAILATSGAEGLDASPRGDAGEVVRVVDDATLMLPDRRGNDRIDSLRNIVRDPRVALLFLIPGVETTLRLNGRAYLTADPQILASFAVDGSQPRSVIVISIGEVYFQCARAIVRSDLWNPENYRSAGDLPTPGTILAALSEDRIGGADYDRAWPERAARTLW